MAKPSGYPVQALVSFVDDAPVIVDENNPLPVVGDLTIVGDQVGVSSSPTITITATPDYSAGDDVGGIISLLTVNSATGRPVLLRSVTLKDNGNQGPPLTLLFFKATPAGGTYTDNAAFAWGQET